MPEQILDSRPRGNGDILTLGFGTTVAMWACGYVCRLPGIGAPASVLFFLLLSCMFVGGVYGGRTMRRGFSGIVKTALLITVLNLLILGSLLGGDKPNEIMMSSLIWIPGTFGVASILFGLGSLAGRALSGASAPATNWAAGFATVAGLATLLLLAVGGAVTGFDHGLAVVDWPNTEGYNMFLYPLARMTGGLYFEHSHRLIGSLVGLTTLVFAVYLQITEDRSWVKKLGWVALVLVVIQGILGGLRVTGQLTLSTSPDDTTPNIVLAIVHGVIGQVFFGLLVALGVVLTRRWREAERVPAPNIRTDHFLGTALVILLVVQLVLGALVRHLTWALYHQEYGLASSPEALAARGTWALHLHITLAVIVVVAAVGLGVRAWGAYPHVRTVYRLGLWLLVAISLQLALGIVAFLVTANDSVENPPNALDVLITTAHQTVGAVLLALALMLVLWQRRLLEPSEASLLAAAKASAAET